MAAVLQLAQLARAAYRARDLVELRHGCVLVAGSLDREHGYGDPSQVLLADVPAPEVFFGPDVGPAVEGLARVAVIAPELLRQVGGFEGLLCLLDRRQADRLDENMRRHHRHAARLVAGPRVDERYRRAVGMADQDAVLNSQGFPDLR